GAGRASVRSLSSSGGAAMMPPPKQGSGVREESTSSPRAATPGLAVTSALSVTSDLRSLIPGAAGAGHQQGESQEGREGRAPLVPGRRLRQAPGRQLGRGVRRAVLTPEGLQQLRREVVEGGLRRGGGGPQVPLLAVDQEGLKDGREQAQRGSKAHDAGEGA